ALTKEMTTTLSTFPTDGIETIYVGGGTPTALNHKQMAYFLDSINQCLQPITENLEFTMEANPSNLDHEKLRIMKTGGVNRLSIGVQSFHDGLLAKIGRTHQSADIYDTIHMAREIGFNNISIDLMYRLPGQTLEQLQQSLDAALSLDIDHISIYSLQVEPRTIFYNKMRKGQLPLPDE